MWLRFYILHNTKIGVPIIDSLPHCHTENALKRDKNQEMWLRCYIEAASLLYIEDKVGVCIIDSIPHCHTKIFLKRRKSRNVASFLYRGRTKLENLSSIVFHTVLLKMLSKMAKIKICDFVSA